jgi:hypothetical protein
MAGEPLMSTSTAGFRLVRTLMARRYHRPACARSLHQSRVLIND